MDVVFQFEQVALYLFLRTVAPDLDNVVVVLVFFLRPAVLPTALFITAHPLDADLESLLQARGMLRP